MLTNSASLEHIDVMTSNPMLGWFLVMSHPSLGFYPNPSQHRIQSLAKNPEPARFYVNDWLKIQGHKTEASSTEVAVEAACDEEVGNHRTNSRCGRCCYPWHSQISTASHSTPPSLPTSLKMPSLSSIAQSVSSKSKSSGTLAVVPLVLASAAIAGYARSAASHHHMEAAQDKAQHAHDEANLHQHIAYPWKGTR